MDTAGIPARRGGLNTVPALHFAARSNFGVRTKLPCSCCLIRSSPIIAFALFQMARCAASELRLAIPGDGAQVCGCGFVHFFDHAVDRYSCDSISGIFRQQIEGASLAVMRLDADYSVAGDGLADVDLAGPDP